MHYFNYSEFTDECVLLIMDYHVAKFIKDIMSQKVFVFVLEEKKRQRFKITWLSNSINNVTKSQIITSFCVTAWLLLLPPHPLSVLLISKSVSLLLSSFHVRFLTSLLVKSQDSRCDPQRQARFQKLQEKVCINTGGVTKLNKTYSNNFVLLI